MNQIVNQTQKKFALALVHFEEELTKIRTGRAHPSMLEGVKVEAYGAEMPLLQVGSVSVPDPQQLQVTPFDPNNLESIAEAIRKNQSLGMNPTDDGKNVRIQVPPLTEERRREYTKLVGTRAEEAKVSLRNARHDARNSIDQAKKDGMSEDEAKYLEQEVDKALRNIQGKIDNAAEAKEQEIMTV